MENSAQMYEQMFDTITNEGNIDACPTYFDKDVKIYDGDLIIDGLSELVKDLKERKESIPDYRVTINDVIISENKAVVRWEAHGMPIRDAGSFKAGEPINYFALTLFELQNSKVRKVWQYGTGVDIN